MPNIQKQIIFMTWQEMYGNGLQRPTLPTTGSIVVAITTTTAFRWLTAAAATIRTTTAVTYGCRAALYIK